MLDPIGVLKENSHYAVVGATQNVAKFGYKIFRMLKDHGKVVYPVNPRYDEIDGEVCYPSIVAVPEKPDVVVSVVRPELTDGLVERCREQGITIIWLQPGTYNPEIVQKCQELGLEAIHGPCVLVKLGEL